MNNYFKIIFFVLFLNFQIKAQDPSFSQIENTNFYTHPSMVSINKGVEIQMAHRRQWEGISGGFTTSFIGVNYQGAKKIGYGICFLNDEEGIGALKTQQTDLVFKYKLYGNYYNLDALIFAISVGYTQKSINWDKLVFSDQIDPVFGIYRNSDQLEPKNDMAIFFDAGFSLTYKRNFRLGNLKLPSRLSLSIHHLGNPDESIQQINEKLPYKTDITYSTTIQRNTLYGIPLLNPVIRFEKQGEIKKISLGSLIGFLHEKSQSTIYTGIFYSSQYSPFNTHNTNAFILTIGYEKIISRTIYTFGYSYDIITSGLRHQSTGGVHEITLAISLNMESRGFKQPSNLFQKCPRGLSTF